MTTLVALHIPKVGTWIGGDRAITKECGLRLPATGRKWHRGKHWAIANAGSIRALDVIVLAGLADRRLAPLRLAEEVRDTLEIDGYQREDGAGALGLPDPWLFANKRGVWDCDGAAQVTPIPSGTLWATGSGRDFALGAGRALLARGVDPELAIAGALEAGCHFDAYSGGGVDVELLA